MTRPAVGFALAALVAAGLAVLPASAVGAVTLAPAVTTATPSPTPSPTPTVDPVRAAEYWLRDYGIEEAWKTTRGAGVTIAVIDTGIARVPELDGAVVDGTDESGMGSDDGRTPVGVVDNNHGTWVASLAAGRGTGAETGMIGVAPEADLLSISVGFGATATVSAVEQIASAVRWAVDHGADVINLSLTTNTLTWDESWDEAFQYAFDHDVVVVVAAGNRGNGTESVGAPATIPGVLTVAGVDPTGRASDRASTSGITIAVAAPSEKLLGVSSDGKVVEWAGTSGAAPIVAGIAALVRSAHPDLNADNVINRILATAQHPSDVGQDPDPLYGYGLVNAEAAVNADVPAIDHSPLGLTLKEWVRLYRRGADADPEVSSSLAAPVEIEPLPAADVPVKASAPFLPTRSTILYGTLPLVAATVPAILIVLGVNAAARRIRSARSQRTPRQ